MRKLVLSTIAAVALATCGLAIAHGLDTKSVKAVSASFTAAPAGTVQTSTCTGADGTYAKSNGTYTGTVTGATGDTSLNGPITINAQSIVNTATNVGVVTGHIRFGSGPGHYGDTQFSAVYSTGNIAGLAQGRVPTSHASLLGNLSAAFSATGGFTNGSLGGANPGGAVEISDGACQPQPTPKPDQVRAQGTVTAISTGSITAAGVTCTIPTNLQAAVTALGLVANTSRVDMTCTVASGVNTLTKLSVDGPHGGHDVEQHGHRH